MPSATTRCDRSLNRIVTQLDQISNAELIELMALFESSIDVQYQVWMAATFALIVASYGSRGRLSLTVRSVIGIVYLVAVVAIYLRWQSDGMRIGLMGRELVERGFDPLIGAWTPEFRRASFLLGSIAAIAFLFYFHKSIEHTD